MSPYGSIITIHRAVVDVPDDVFERFGHTQEYGRFIHQATFGADTSSGSGANSYAHEEQWLESMQRTDCMNFINNWHNKILQWQEQMRSEEA